MASKMINSCEAPGALSALEQTASFAVARTNFGLVFHYFHSNGVTASAYVERLPDFAGKE